jgi:hypothetical protein
MGPPHTYDPFYCTGCTVPGMSQERCSESSAGGNVCRSGPGAGDKGSRASQQSRERYVTKVEGVKVWSNLQGGGE